MKKIFVLILVISLLIMGCDTGGSVPTEPNAPGQSGGEQTTNPTSGGNTVEPTRPAEVELVDYNAPALKVRITINPELELTLSRTNEILEVKALNADAEGLLAGMDLVGQPYDSGIVTILEEAKEQKYLKDVSKVTMTVEELSEGAWTIATEEQLTKPVEDYQQNSGIIFSCRLTPAGESVDIDELQVIDTSRNGDVFVTVYGDASGNDKLHIYEKDDGTRTEGYFISDTEEIWINYYSDGSYRYSYNEGLVSQGYFLYPDGSGFTYVEYRELVDGLTQPVWYQAIYFDGSTIEDFYENGQPVRTVITNADGSTWENFYENGQFVGGVGTTADGGTFEQTCYLNGNVKTYTESREGRYVELYYDENGLMISMFQREPDGTEYDWDYENGEAVGCTVTYPDGSSEYHSYN